MSEEKTARIDGVLYSWDELPPVAREVLETLSFIDRKVAEFENEKLIFELARANCLSALKENLPDGHEERKRKQDHEGKPRSDAPDSFGSDDIDFSKIIDEPGKS